MTKRVVIVHGWDGHPQEGWFPWLKSELEAKGFEVLVPQLPDPESPRIYNWIPKLEETVGKIDEKTFFVGHSMGCQAIVRLLEKQPVETKAGGAVFVAGFFKHLTGLEDDVDVQKTDKHWLNAPLNLDQVFSHLPKSVAIFSDNDPWVPLDNQDDFKKKLHSEIVIEHNAGHFSGSLDKRFDLVAARDAVLKLANND